MVGPIAVRGAEAGDVLEVLIERVRPCGWGWTYAGGGMATPGWNAGVGVGGSALTLLKWTLDESRREATSDKGDVVPVRAFMGTLGLVPDEEHASGWVPRVCGGNMDCRELVEGSRLQLPVQVAGGMLSLGDGHAAQGDGEVSGTAIECAMEEVRLRLTLVKGKRISGPRIKTPEGAWVALGFGETLDIAAERAVSGMLDVMMEETGRERAELLALASMNVSLRVTQTVNPHRGVHAVWGGATRSARQNV